MAEIKIPNLCGSSPEFNSIQDKFEKLIDEAIDNLEAEASAAASAASSAFTDLESELRALVSLAPTLPQINLQSLLTSLSSMTPGTFEHITLLKDIKDDFETELAAAGHDIDTLVTNALTQIQSGGDLCTVVPNFTKPADGSSDAKEVSVESKQPTVDSEEEEPPTFLRNAILFVQQEDAKVKVASMQVEGESEEIDVVGGTVTSTTPPTKDTGAYTVTEAERSVVYKTTPTGKSQTESKESETKEPKAVKVTTPKEQKGKNITTSRFTTRINEIVEIFTEDQVDIPLSGGDHVFELKQKPTRGGITFMKGNQLRRSWRPRSVPPNERKYIQSWRWLYDKNVGGPPLKNTPFGRYEVDGNKVTIFGRGNQYIPHSEGVDPGSFRKEKEGQMFQVGYMYMENYDPSKKA